jgi:hypothetical protein
MACPNFKNGPKKGLGPLGLKYLSGLEYLSPYLLNFKKIIWKFLGKKHIIINRTMNVCFIMPSCIDVFG